MDGWPGPFEWIAEIVDVCFEELFEQEEKREWERRPQLQVWDERQLGNFNNRLIGNVGRVVNEVVKSVQEGEVECSGG